MSKIAEIDQDDIFKFLSDDANTFQMDVLEEDLIVPEHQVQAEEPELKEEVKDEKPIPEETEEFKALQVLIRTGRVEDTLLEIEGEEVKLSEFKNIDESTLKEVLEAIEENKKEALKTDYIKVKDLDEKRKALVDIITSGDISSVREVFKDPQVLEEPMKGYDPNNADHNQSVYFNYLTKVKGLDEEDAVGLVQASINNFTIDKKALEIVESSRKAHVEMLQNKAKEIKELEKQEKEDLKVYTKNLSDTLQTYELKPEKVLEITKLATQKDSEGNLLIDNLYEDVAKDPNKAAKLFLFLSDPELYDKLISAKEKATAEIAIAKKIRLIPETKKNNTTDIEKPQERAKNIQDFLMEDYKN